MAWFSGKVSLGNFPDLAGAVNKLSESVKNIEKNFDSALGFEEKSDASSNEASGLWPSATERNVLFEPVRAFMGQTIESSKKSDISSPSNSIEEKVESETDSPAKPLTQQSALEESSEEKIYHDMHSEPPEWSNTAEPAVDHIDAKVVAEVVHVESSEPNVEPLEESDSSNLVQQKEISESGSSGSAEMVAINLIPDEVEAVDQAKHESDIETVSRESSNERKTEHEEVSPIQSLDASPDNQERIGTEPTSSISAIAAETENSDDSYKTHDSSIQHADEAIAAETTSSISAIAAETESSDDSYKTHDSAIQHADEVSEMVPALMSNETDAMVQAVIVNQQSSGNETDLKEQHLSSAINSSDTADSMAELEKLKREMKMMETALQGAARQAQAKADEIAKLMNENEHLKGVIEELRRKSNEAEIESLREEYHQRVAGLERKVYALTKERDTLRREQNKKSDAAALLKEKDEIINQVMAEGEELSKKQAAQEATIRKLRAQIREFEEEKKGLVSKLQVEENKVESIKRDKAATENLLQETIERHQAELATQKEYYTNALNAAKEAESLAEARANNEARTEIESRLREAEEREAMLVQTLEELRQTLTRNEQQAVFREDMLRRDIEDLQKRYQASERRCEELVTQVPESTRPLLRQIEAMQETTSRRAEAWAAVERSLNSRLQEAEGKAASAEERERSINERLSQTLSRVNVLEAQISCLRAEQTQLTRSLEKERQRAAESRQEYLALKEEADTHEGRVNQLEEEIRELRRKHKQELHEALTHRELLQQEVEREKAARLEMERTAARVQSSAVSDPLTKQKSLFDNGNLSRRLSSASSLSSMEESYFLQASLDSSDVLSERVNAGEMGISPYYMKSMPPSAFEATLRQKEGELASYMSRLASLESIRDSLAEELVKMTELCEKLRVEAAVLPGIRAELEALRRRHSAALELMGERDEELEELRADIVDLKEMYREQVNLLVNKIQVFSSSG